MDILDIDKTEEENPHNRPGVKFGDEEEDGEGYEKKKTHAFLNGFFKSLFTNCPCVCKK